MQENDSTDLQQTPDIDQDTGRPKRSAVKDAAQAFSAWQELEKSSRERRLLVGTIWEYYSGKAPFSEGALKEDGQDWRNNFCTFFMASIVDRRYPEFVQLIEGSTSLTNVRLPADTKDSGRKSKVFRQKFTALVRGWEEWRDFLYDSAREDVLVGYGCISILDPQDWRPKIYSSNDFFAADGTGSGPKKCAAIGFRDSLLIHEATELLIDTHSSAETGWNIPNMIKHINEAQPERKGSSSIAVEDLQALVEVIQEGTTSSSYCAGAKVLRLAIYLATEADGSVTQYILEEKSGDELFCKKSRFNSMQDAMAFLTLQVGTRKLYGSKGLGRFLVNFQLGVERSRMMFLDALSLSGNVVMKCDPASRSKARQLEMFVSSPFTIIYSDGEFLKDAFNVNVEGFLAADNRLTQIAEQIAGAVLPGQVNLQGNSEKTATEATIDYQREEQIKAGVMARYAMQMAKVLQLMQRRACDPFTTDPEARTFQAELLQEGLTAEDIVYLAKQPPARSIQDLDSVIAQKIVQVLQKYAGSPFVDQGALVRMDVENTLPDDVAQAILIPETNDGTVEAEQSRQQVQEVVAMAFGQQMAISGRDNDLIHLRTLVSKAKDIQSLPLQVWPVIAEHYAGHIAAGEKKGQDVRQFVEFGQQMKQEFERRMQEQQKAQQEQQAAQQEAQQLEAQRQRQLEYVKRGEPLGIGLQ